MRSQSVDEPALRRADGDVFAKIDRGDDQIIAAIGAGCGHDTFGIHVPDSPDPLDIRVLGQHGTGSLFGITGKVRPSDPLFIHDLDVGVIAGDGGVEGVMALLGHEVLGGVDELIDFGEVRS